MKPWAWLVSAWKFIKINIALIIDPSKKIIVLNVIDSISVSPELLV